jgi:ribonuclease PH
MLMRAQTCLTVSSPRTVRRQSPLAYPMHRQLECDKDVLARASGSVRWRQGDTEVLAAVHGPQPALQRVAQADRAVVEVVLRPRFGLPGQYTAAGRSLRAAAIGGRQQQRLCVFLCRQQGTPLRDDHQADCGVVCQPVAATTEQYLHCAAGMVCLPAFPSSRTVRSQMRNYVISTNCLQVVSSDGATLACAINATCAVLMDAGVPLHFPFGVALRLKNDDSVNFAASNMCCRPPLKMSVQLCAAAVACAVGADDAVLHPDDAAEQAR